MAGRTKGFVTRKIERRGGRKRTKGWMRRGIRRESEAEIKWREREIKGKEKIWGGGKEKANIQDAVTVRGRCVAAKI